MFGLRATSSPHGSHNPQADVQASLRNPSVRNTSSDLVTNDIPSTFVIPISDGSQFEEGDFVFAITPENDTKRPRRNEANIMTLPQLNTMLRKIAVGGQGCDAANVPTWSNEAAKLAHHATPFGVVINKMKVTEGKYGVNICVSRRANVKNNFWSSRNGGSRNWFLQSTTRLAVLYSEEEVKNVANDNVQTVVVSMLALDDSDWEEVSAARNKLCYVAESKELTDAETFCDNLIQKDSVVVPIGRVLNSSLSSPTRYVFLHSLFDKAVYDKLKPIEVELGC
jgi:hypothetical protein